MKGSKKKSKKQNDKKTNEKVSEIFKYEIKEDERNDMIDAFHKYDKNNNGEVDLKEAVEAFQDLNYAKTAEEAKEIINAYDYDGNGKLGQDEFVDLLTMAPKDSFIADTVRKAFEFFDKNGTGKIKMKEFMVILTKLGNGLSDDIVKQMFDNDDNINPDDEDVDYIQFINNWRLIPQSD